MFNYIFFVFLFFLSFLVKFMKKVFVVWCLLEIYSVIFLLMVFMNSSFFYNKKALMYFGFMKIFSSVGFVFSMMKDFSLLGFIFILVKMGVFPLLDWVISFLNSVEWFISWIFFSLSKVMPYYIFSEFLNMNLKMMILFFVFNFFYSLSGAFRASKYLKLISWSSVGSSSFFILLMSLTFKMLNWEILFFIYSFMIFFLFFNLKKNSLSNYLLTAMLFGIPPLSLFIFKVGLVVKVIFINGIFLYYMLSMFLCLFGVSYFCFYLRESQNFMLVNSLEVLSINNFFQLKVMMFLFFLTILILK